MDQTEKKSLSFGFSKIKDKKTLQKSAIRNEDKFVQEETEYVTSLEDKAVKSSKPKVEAKPLVIPLIQTNKWHIPTPCDIENDTETPKKDEKANKHQQINKTGDDITDQALQELVSEANQQYADFQGGDALDPNRAIPLLLKNKIPEGFETDDKLDVSLRPDEAADANYDEVPIEQYGMALLRGMGFKDGQGIGKNHKSVAPIEAVARPKGLGLGADRSLSLQKKDGGKTTEKNKQDENLVMKKGAFCIICAGKNDGYYATVEGLDEDNARVVVKTAIGGNSLTLNQMAVRLVSKQDFDKNSKILNKSKVDKYKEDEAKRERRHKSDSPERVSDRRHRDDHREQRPRDDQRDDKHHSDKHHSDKHRHKKHKKDRHRDRHSEDSDGEYHSHKHSSRHQDEASRYRDDTEESSRHKKKDKRRERSQSPSDKGRDRDRSRSPHDKHSRDKSPKHKKHSLESSSKSKNGSRPAQWMRPNLRVRVIDPEYKKGKYYKSKVVIEDVISYDTCICRTDEGKVLEGLTQKILETVIPKTKSSNVMVVSGEHKGKVGEILERDSAACVAVLQTLPDCDEILTLDYDVICEFTGNPNDVVTY